MNDAFVESFETQVSGRLCALALTPQTPHLGSGLACLTSVQRILLGQKAGHHAKFLVKILSTSQETSEEHGVKTLLSAICFCLRDHYVTCWSDAQVFVSERALFWTKVQSPLIWINIVGLAKAQY